MNENEMTQAEFATDVALMARVAEGDETAANEVFDAHAEPILCYLIRRVGRTQADDLFQEVFARAFRSASKFRGRSNVRAWLYGIARYTLLELRRKHQSMHSLPSLIFSGSGPESIAFNAEEEKRITAALEQLPDDQAIVLELHRIDGISHEEIAKMLGIETAASRKRLQRATKALLAILESEDLRAATHAHIHSWRESLLNRALPEGASVLAA